MKRVYTTPVASVEEFEANEYVAACYYLACQVNGSKDFTVDSTLWDMAEFGGVKHSTTGTANTCGDASANRVITESNGLVEDASVGEYNGEQGWITGGIDTWIDSNNNGIVDSGDIIYWHTYSAKKDRRWNHVGKIQDTKAGHPNHS